jgi:uncharacterized protein
MPTRATAPDGAPCWADLWTSDVDGSRRFYGELFGWDPQEPSPEFGGYFMFLREGAPVAGGMGSMGDMPANDTWKVYFSTPDVARAVQTAEELGAKSWGPPMPVADLGTQAVLADPTGSTFGLWQPGTFHGFSALGEPSAPSWFELRTTDYTGALSFCSRVLSLEAHPMGDGSFRYATLRQPGSEEDLAGVMDAALDPGGSTGWTIYWDVLDAQAALEQVVALGGTAVSGPQPSPYGTMATVKDPAGAEFRLRAPSALPE